MASWEGKIPMQKELIKMSGARNALCQPVIGGSEKEAVTGRIGLIDNQLIDRVLSFFLSIHRIPHFLTKGHLDPRREVWMRVCGLKDNGLVKRICGRHFKAEDYLPKPNQTLLRPHAIPSLHLPNRSKEVNYEGAKIVTEDHLNEMFKSKAT